MEIDNLKLFNIDDLKGVSIKSGKLICSQSKTETFPNIHPITYLRGNQFIKFEDFDEPLYISYGAKFKNSPTDIDSVYEPLYERFSDNELFYLNKFQDNNNQYAEPYFAFGNDTEKLDDKVIEIYEGDFDPKKVYFKPKSHEIFILISSKIERGDRYSFYVKNGESVYGPFNAIEIDDKDIILSAERTNNNSIFCWKYIELQGSYILSFTTLSQGSVVLNRLITNNLLPEDLCDQQIIFLSDDELALWFINKIQGVEKFDDDLLKHIFQYVLKLESTPDEGILYDRCYRLFDTAIKDVDRLKNIVDAIKSIKDIDKYIEDKNIKKENLNLDISALEVQQVKIKNKVSEMEFTYKEIQNKNDEAEVNISEHINSRIENANKENVELKVLLQANNKIEVELQKIELYMNIEGLQTTNEYLENNKQELEDSIKTLSKEFIDTQKEAHEKLRELVKSKTHFDFISGRDFNNNHAVRQKVLKENICSTPISSFYNRNIEDEKMVSHEKLLVNEVKKTLKKYGREYPIDFIANILICFYQNTATIFSGAPGSGKTSLARLLTNILTKDTNKTVEISVAKGWTTPKDLIGFFNPLSKQFVPANEKLYNLIHTLEKESTDGIFRNTNMGFVILDEANLSPIEHYWSIFYNLTDSHAFTDKLLSLELGTGNCVAYANNLRFIGTINTDQTTEELSPRVIDRTHIIRVASNNDFVLQNTNAPSHNIQSIDITFGDILKMFNLKDFSDNKDAIDFEQTSLQGVKADYIKIKNAFKDLNISISFRVDKDFIAYVFTASKFMSSHKALDYFVSQRLLTKIDGQGQSFAESLKDLRDICNKVFSDKKGNSATEIILNELIETGERDAHFHNYNYFLLN